MAFRIETHRIDVHGRIARYAVTGEGESLLLIHGLSGSTRWWHPVVPTLSARFRVYLLNLPGFGAFRGRQPPLPLVEAAGWVEAWTEAVGVKRCHIAAHSMGGAIALDLAASVPHLVDRLVLVAPAALPAGGRVGEYLGSLARSVRYVSPRFLPVLAYDALRAGPATLLHTAQDLFQHGAADSLSTIESPTLLVWGEHDLLIPMSVAATLRDTLPHARLAVIPNAGHVPMYDRPKQFADPVLSFLAEDSLPAR